MKSMTRTTCIASMFFMKAVLTSLLGCAPDLKGMCEKNSECIEGYLCNQENNCVSVEQKNIEILTTQLKDAVVGEPYVQKLSVKGGLGPFLWQKKKGPNWLKVVKKEKDDWFLMGDPKTYQKEEMVVELTVTDSSIGEGQIAVSENLSLRILYCLSSQDKSEVCQGRGTCVDEGLCRCDEGYAGFHCDACDTAGGYEKNQNGECVRYEFQCNPEKTCGANVYKCECVGDGCESIENCDLYLECGEGEVCRVNDQIPVCDDCQGFGCSYGMCNGCTQGLCCDTDTKKLKPNTFNCASWIEYKCEGAACGAKRLRGSMLQYCDGQTSGCNGAVSEEWQALSTCDSNALCASNNKDTEPACIPCEHGCSVDTCKECSIGTCCGANGWFKEKGIECFRNTKYRCTGPVCGGYGEEWQEIKKCSGISADCDGEIVIKNWTSVNECSGRDICSTNGNDFPDCLPNGCCTADGVLLQDCWYDPDMDLAWQEPPFDETMKWLEAKIACNNLSPTNFWRLPNITELRSFLRRCEQTQVTSIDTGVCRVLDPECLDSTCIKDGDEYICDGCGIDPASDCYWGQDMQGSCFIYWSSSHEKNSSEPWFVDFRVGHVGYSGPVDASYNVRCVKNEP